MSRALERGKSQGLHPADLAASPPESELGCGALWINGIERRRDGSPESIGVVWMHRPQKLFDRRFTHRHFENFLTTRIA